MPRGVGDWQQAKMLRARELRKNMSESEQKLWKVLRNNQLGVRVRRQVPVGPYVIDFYIPELRFAIEVDGDQHVPADDAVRDQELRESGVETFRISSRDLYDDHRRQEVLDALWYRLEELRRG